MQLKAGREGGIWTHAYFKAVRCLNREFRGGGLRSAEPLFSGRTGSRFGQAAVTPGVSVA